MKVLIGTPIHEVKDYCMERWLENVAKLKYPADLLLVDNSHGLEYVEKVKQYCKKLGLAGYKIEHLDTTQGLGDEEIHERVARSREIIRHVILSKDYEAWFSWECDQIIPTDALNKLTSLMEAGDFMVAVHNSWDRDKPGQNNLDFGVALIKKECLKKYSFLPKFGASSDEPDNWYNAELYYRERLLKDGYKYVELYGVIDPIYHLDK